MGEAIMLFVVIITYQNVSAFKLVLQNDNGL